MPVCQDFKKIWAKNFFLKNLVTFEEQGPFIIKLFKF
jgi:hypothetical protein